MVKTGHSFSDNTKQRWRKHGTKIVETPNNDDVETTIMKSGNKTTLVNSRNNDVENTILLRVFSILLSLFRFCTIIISYFHHRSFMFSFSLCRAFSIELYIVLLTFHL
jgi:hypothetical protein